VVEKALVLMSGGLDSATSLYWAKNKFDQVQAITFNYYERINREKIAARAITKLAQVNMTEVKIPFIKEKSDYSHFKRKFNGQPSQSYIPLRNLIFYSIAGYFAQINKISNLVGGHNATDGKIFNDATESYFRKMNELILQGLVSSVDCKILLPLKDMSRPDVIRLAKTLKVPIEMTWSCHRQGKFPCGRCYACKQRLNAFSLLRLKDPAPYSNDGSS
jgi:7-cyano-7-deazaguanine synthase